MMQPTQLTAEQQAVMAQAAALGLVVSPPQQLTQLQQQQQMQMQMQQQQQMQMQQQGYYGGGGGSGSGGGAAGAVPYGCGGFYTSPPTMTTGGGGSGNQGAPEDPSKADPRYY